MQYIKTLITSFLVLFALLSPVTSSAQIGVGVSADISVGAPVAIAPPAIPVYVVPAPPQEGFIWVPGHWRWGIFGYYWVPGTWVQPPTFGYLWTPGYWGWGGGGFGWREGYWGTHVGFYGGINYGGGYGGHGFNGGGWQGNMFVVNRSVTNVTNITNVTNVTNASFNGGPGGTHDAPTHEEQAAMHEKHLPPTADQVKNVKAASSNPQLRASANNGKPAIAATTHPGVFAGKGVVAAKQAGPKNVEAEKHNQAVIKNPALAKGAAIPKAANNAGAHKPVNQQEKPEAMQHQPAARPAADSAERNSEVTQHPQPVSRPAAQRQPGGGPYSQSVNSQHSPVEHRPEAAAPHPQAAAPHPQPAPHPAERKPEEGEHKQPE